MNKIYVKSIFMCLLMVMMSQSPILQNTVMELEDEKAKLPTSESDLQCPLTSEVYADECDEWIEIGTTMAQTLIHFATDLDELSKVMNDFERGNSEEVASTVIDAIIENSPEDNTYEDIDGQKSTAASGMVSMPLPITQDDWFCILFPLLCPKITQHDTYSVSGLSGETVDDLRFQLLADALSGDSISEISTSLDNLIEDINAETVQAEEDTEARVVGWLIFGGTVITWVVTQVITGDFGAAGPSTNGGTSLNALLPAALARSMMATSDDISVISKDDLGGIFWWVIGAVIAIGASMKGCESYSSGCTLPDIPTDELVVSVPKQFIEENQNYLDSLFESDSTTALRTHETMMSRYDETHGKLMMALQSECTPGDDSVAMIEGTNQMMIQSPYIPVERIQHDDGASGRDGGLSFAALMGIAVLGGMLVSVLMNSQNDGGLCGPQPPGGTGVTVAQELRDGGSLPSIITDEDSADLDSFVEIVSFMQPPESSSENNDLDARMAEIVLTALVVSDYEGPYLASTIALSALVVYEANRLSKMPAHTMTESDCAGWNQIELCAETINKANKAAFWVDFIYIIFDGYMPILGPIAVEADDETSSRSDDDWPWALVEWIIDVMDKIDSLNNWPYIPSNDFAPGHGSIDIDLSDEELSTGFDKRLNEYQDFVTTTALRADASTESLTTNGRWVIAVLEGLALVAGAYMGQDIVTDWWDYFSGSANPGAGPDGYTEAMFDLYKGNPTPSMNEIELALRPDANGNSDERSALVVELLSLDESGAYILGAESEFAQESCISDHTHATSGRVKHGCTPLLPFRILSGMQTLTPATDIGGIDFGNLTIQTKSSVNAKLDTYEMLKLLPDMSDIEPTSNESVETLERLENKFFGTTQASCLVESGYGVAIAAESSARAGGPYYDLSPYAILLLLIKGTTIFTSTGGNTIDVTTDMMLDREPTDDWDMPIWDDTSNNGTDPDILEEIEIMWAVADVANEWAIDQGLSPEKAHVFATGVAMIMAYSAEGATMMADTDDTATTARASLPFLPLPWLLEWWLIIRIVSGEDGYTVNDDSTAAECMGDDFDYDVKSQFAEDLDTDGDGVPNSMETDPDCWNTPANSKTTDEGCMMAEDLKDGTGDGTSDSTSDSSDEDEDDDGFLPGFGFMSTLISLLGVAILLQRKQREDND